MWLIFALFTAFFTSLMDVFGKKWTVLILWPLMEGPRRFTEMSAFIPGISDRLLSQRLQELEEKGIVERQVFNERPVRVEYRLTEKGHDVRQVLEAIMQWADRWEASAEPNPA